MKKPSISFYTLGCRLNQSETAVIQNSLEQSGYRISRFGERSDITVINTCTVTENSENDTRRLINRIVRNHPLTQIALVGCQAQLHKNDLAKLPNVRWIIGTAKKMDLAEIFSQPSPTALPQILVPTIPREIFTIPVAGIDRQHTRANIKIQDGCDEFCSFCEIPYARGRARSRQFKDIRTEAQTLVNARHQELVLTGINIGKYAHAGKTIINVVKSLEEIKNLQRIRISSIEPMAVDHKLFACMFPHGKLCRHLHIPVQSGSNKILKMMRRPYTTEFFEKLIRSAINAVPGICIGTDVIVGFPGETEEDFIATFEFLKKLPIHYLHVFSYSQRKMAKSKNLPGQVERANIQERSATLRKLGAQKRRQFNSDAIGQTQTVLFEQKKERDWLGLTDNFLHVRLQTNTRQENKFQKIKLVSCEGEEIRAQLIPYPKNQQRDA